MFKFEFQLYEVSAVLTKEQQQMGLLWLVQEEGAQQHMQLPPGPQVPEIHVIILVGVTTEGGLFSPGLGIYVMI